ncbi:zonadhesin-like isoform X2 [Haliotis rufescens]|uniref:zonadhesin-like isoform X2 n=1 Tax=Haliotis rufescens TaxID=6454 RepID=UPI00201E92F9|nr:zonadhesin-like isoform X2 [Haliotis rufescens]
MRTAVLFVAALVLGLAAGAAVGRNKRKVDVDERLRTALKVNNAVYNPSELFRTKRAINGQANSEERKPLDLLLRKKRWGLLGKIGRGIKKAARKVGSGVRHAGRKVGSGVRHAARKVGSVARSAHSKVVSFFRGSNKLHKIRSGVRSVVSGAKSFARKVGSKVKSTGHNVRSFAQKVVSRVKSAGRGIHSIGRKIGSKAHSVIHAGSVRTGVKKLVHGAGSVVKKVVSAKMGEVRGAVSIVHKALSKTHSVVKNVGAVAVKGASKVISLLKHSHEKSHGKSHGRSHGKTHKKSHGKSRGKSHGKSHKKSHGKSRGKSHKKSHGKSHKKSHGKSRKTVHTGGVGLVVPGSSVKGSLTPPTPNIGGEGNVAVEELPQTGDVVAADEDFCRCKVNGDPHYRTFDGQMINFMGECMYTLSKSIDQSDPCAFNVEIKNEVRDGKTMVSWARLIDFSIYGLTVRLALRRKVYVNGLRKYPPFIGANGKLSVTINGQFVQVTTMCGIEVAFDGLHLVKVKVPKRYATRMTGLCGDCNGIEDDFRLSNGTDVSTLDTKFSQIGNSYLVFDNSDKPDNTDNCRVVEPDINCGADVINQLDATDKCGMIKDRSGPFAACINALSGEVQEYYEACTFDACLHKDDEDEMKGALCKSLEAFASECEESGFNVKWRSANMCPMDCGANSFYNPEITGCRQQCGASLSSALCDLDPREGCECAAGYILSGEECVKQEDCGCVETRDYFPIGTKLSADDCSTVRECKKVSGLPVFVDVVVGQKCASNAMCGLFEGERKCACFNGFSGDGVTSCVSLQFPEVPPELKPAVVDPPKVDVEDEIIPENVVELVPEEPVEPEEPAEEPTEPELQVDPEVPVQEVELEPEAVPADPQLEVDPVQPEAPAQQVEEETQVIPEPVEVPKPETKPAEPIFETGENVVDEPVAVPEVALVSQVPVLPPEPQEEVVEEVPVIKEVPVKVPQPPLVEEKPVVKEVPVTVDGVVEEVPVVQEVPVEVPQDPIVEEVPVVEEVEQVVNVPAVKSVEPALAPEPESVEEVPVDKLVPQVPEAPEPPRRIEIPTVAPETAAPETKAPIAVVSEVPALPETAPEEVPVAVVSEVPALPEETAPEEVPVAVVSEVPALPEATPEEVPVAVVSEVPALPEEAAPEEVPVSESSPEPEPVKVQAPCSCMAKGDPHYTTFDGAHLSLSEDCKYVMAEVKDAPGCNVRVEVKNEKRPRSKFPERAFTRLVDVKLGEDRIRLGNGKRILVNGASVDVGLSSDGFNITKDGFYNVVTTSCNIVVKFDGDYIARVIVPATFKTQLSGLCGNCDGSESDDLTVNGRSIDSYDNRKEGLLALVSQFIVRDDSDKPSTNPVCQTRTV